MTTTPVIYSTNPFNTDINPATTTGLKLYKTATAARDDSQQLNPKIGNSKEFIDAMQYDSAKFSWGQLISKVEIEGSNDKKDILLDFRELSIKNVRQFMGKVYFNKDGSNVPDTASQAFDIDPASDDDDKKIFFKRVRSDMIAHRIMNSLKPAALASLKLKESKFLWKSSDGEIYYDGVTMLQILIEKVNPTTRVGVVDLKDKIRNAKMANYSHNVREMTDKLQSYYNDILRKGRTHEDFVLDLFNALGSGKNDVFCDFIQRKKDEWDTGVDIEADQLIKDALAKYNNMVTQKTWNSKESKDSKIIALTTQVQALEKRLEDKSSHSSSSSKKSTGDKSEKAAFSTKYKVAEWRLKKTFGDTVDKDGKTFHWCSKQHQDGKGMYVTHKEEDHTAWKEKKDQWKANKSSKGGNSNSKAQEKNKSMTLSDGLKAAMVSKFKCSAADAEKLYADVAKHENF
jgi:hypothetical protein